jgi:hypothetical protein
LHRVVHHLTVASRSDSARSRTPFSLRGGHIGTRNSAVTDDNGAISRRRSPVANFTMQSTLKRNIVTFANVVHIACSVARTNFPIRKVLRF